MTEFTEIWAKEKIESYGLSSDYVDAAYLATILLKNERRGAEIEKLQAELDAIVDTLHQEIDEMQDFIDRMWQAVILDYKPDYGDWTYPDMALRHIVQEVDQLRRALIET